MQPKIRELTENFVQQRIGKYVWMLGDHQCVAPFWDYNNRLNQGEPYSVDYAAQLVDVPWKTWDVIAPDQELVYGDWCSWAGDWGAYQNNGAGHVAMFIADYNGRSGYFYSQNPDIGKIMILSYDGIHGYLRRKDGPMLVAPTVNYQLIEQFTAKNWTPAALAPAVFRQGPRVIVGITIHWWGNPVGQTFAGIVDWFCNPFTSATTSAHYITSAGQVACIVSPEDVAWHSGNAVGNTRTVGIEANPRCSDEDYQTLAELIAWLRFHYGRDLPLLPLYPHNYWASTSCPGNYDLARLDRMATAILNGDDMATLTEAQDKALSLAWQNSTAALAEAKGIRQDLAQLREQLETPPVIAVKGKTSPDIFVYDPNTGGLRHIDGAEWAVLSGAGVKYRVVDDKVLAPFRAGK